MFDRDYKVITLVGTSTESWERVKKTLQDLHIAKIKNLDMQISNGKIIAYNAKVMVPSKYSIEDEI
jgi:flavin-binding protein dodecin